MKSKLATPSTSTKVPAMASRPIASVSPKGSDRSAAAGSSERHVEPSSATRVSPSAAAVSGLTRSPCSAGRMSLSVGPFGVAEHHLSIETASAQHHAPAHHREVGAPGASFGVPSAVARSHAAWPSPAQGECHDIPVPMAMNRVYRARKLAPSPALRLRAFCPAAAAIIRDRASRAGQRSQA